MLENKISKETLKVWLKDRHNQGLIFILIIAFLVRLYFFFQTFNQPLWWDEAEYMATSKHWAFGIPYDINPQRPPLFQILGFFLLKMSFGEMGLKFILVLIPSLFVVACTYFLGKEMFSKRVGLFAALGSAFMWSYLFWSSRFQPDFISLSLQLLAILFVWKTFKNDSPKWAILAGLFSAAAFYFKISALLIPLIAGLFGLWVEGFKAFKIKKYWIVIGSYLLALLPFLIWQYVVFGDPIAFSHGYADLSGKLAEGWQPGWMVLDYFYSFSKLSVFIAFGAGVLLFLWNFSLSFDLRAKSKELRLDASLFSFLLLTISALFYIFFIRGIIEDRWVFLFAPFIYFFAAEGCFSIADWISKHHKKIGHILILIVVLSFVYYSLVNANAITIGKKDSYAPIKEASLYIKQISKPNESILSLSYTQATTYSERLVIPYPKFTPENFTKVLDEKKPSYLMTSFVFENHLNPPWLMQQRMTQDGKTEILSPYLNSSIIISPQGTITSLDIKESVLVDDKYQFDLVYPKDNLNGVFVYKITYH